MKIRVKRESFLEACRLAERVLVERAADHVLAHLLVQARVEGCSLLATDGEVGLRVGLEAVVGRPGQALLPGRRALAILREVGADELVLEAAPGALLLRGPGVAFDLEVPAPAAFPGLESFPGGACHLLPAGPLRQAARRTLFAAGEQTARYSLQGVLWELEPDGARLVATDNRRLAVAEISTLGSCDHLTPASRLLPARCLDLLARLAADPGDRVEALFGPRHAFFRAGRATLCARYLAGDYPVWRKVVPDRPPLTLALPVGQLLSGVRQAAVLREQRGPRLVLRFEPGRLTLESREAGAGASRVEQALPFAGSPLAIALNPRHLVELLRTLDPDADVELGLADPDGPVLFSAGADYRHVLMPLPPG